MSNLPVISEKHLEGIEAGDLKLSIFCAQMGGSTAANPIPPRMTIWCTDSKKGAVAHRDINPDQIAETLTNVGVGDGSVSDALRHTFIDLLRCEKMQRLLGEGRRKEAIAVGSTK